GGVTDCQVPPSTVTGDHRRIDDKHLAGDAPVVVESHGDHALIIKQPPVSVRQAEIRGPLARQVADALPGADVPPRSPHLPALVVARRLGQDADALHFPAFGCEMGDLLQPRPPPVQVRWRRRVAGEEVIEVGFLVVQGVGLAGLEPERRAPERLEQVAELVLSDRDAHQASPSMTSSGTNTASSSVPRSRSWARVSSSRRLPWMT